MGIVAIVIIVVAVIILRAGADRQRKKDCYGWQETAKQSNLFKPSAEMLATCQEVGINLKK